MRKAVSDWSGRSNNGECKDERKNITVFHTTFIPFLSEFQSWVCPSFSLYIHVCYGGALVMHLLNLFKISRFIFCCNVFLASYQLDAPTGEGQVWTCLPTELMYFCQFLSAENTPFCSSQQQQEQKPRISDQVFPSKLYHVAQLEPGGEADDVSPFLKDTEIYLF